MALFPTNATQIQTFATALYGIQVGSTTLTQVTSDIQAAGGLNNALNAYYSASFGSAATASVAATIVANVGLGTDANAVAFVTAQLNAAAPAARGAAVIAMLDNFLNTTTGTYAAAAASFNTTVANAVAYNGSGDITLSQAATTGKSFTYTVGNNSPTFTSGLTITGSASSNDTLTLNDSGTAAITLSVGAGSVVTSVENLVVNGAGTDTITADTSSSGWGSIQNVTVNSGAAQTLTGSASQNITSVTSATGAVTIDGGNSVTSTSTETTGAAAVALGSVVIGGTTAPVGAVNVTNTQSFVTALSTLGDITVTGGAGVTVNSKVNQTTALVVHAGATGTDEAAIITVTPTSGAVTVNDATNIASVGGITTFADAVSVLGGSTVTVNETVTQTSLATTASSITMGAVNVTGDLTTTAVTVNQPAKTTSTTGGLIKTDAVAKVVAVDGVAAVAAAPGQNPISVVTAVTAVTAAAAKVSTATVTADGAVTIADKNAASGTVANTITAVTLNNYGASTIASNALSTLNLSGTASTLTITNANTAATTAKASTLNLSLTALDYTGANGTTNAITDANNEISTLNVNLVSSSSLQGAAALSTTAFTDTGLKTVNVSGTGVLTMGAWGTAPTSITVTGAAGYKGLITDTTTVFNASASTGANTVGISATPTKAVTGGTGTNEIIVNAAAVADTTATTANLATFNANVTGFKTLGVSVAAANLTWDMSKLSSGINAIAIEGGTYWGGAVTGTNTFNNVAAGTTVSVTGAMAGALAINTSDTTGVSDSIAFTTTNSTALTGGTSGTIAALTVADANGVGVGTLSFANTGTTTITTLTDTALSNLSTSGSGKLIISTLASDTSTQLTLTNNSTAATASVAAVAAGLQSTIDPQLKITAMTDNVLGNLTFAGSAQTVITTLTDSAANLTITSNDSAKVQIGTLAEGSAATTTVTVGGTGWVDIGVITTTSAAVVLRNTGTGTVSVADGSTTGFVDANITSLTLSGNIAFGTDAAAADTAIGGTNLATVAAGTDNAHINLHVGAIGNAVATSYVLGNGNNNFKSDSTAGQITLTVGTGSNLIDVSSSAANNATFSANITLGSHTSAGPDQILVGAIGTNLGVNTVITGAVAGDQIVFHDTGTSVKTFTASELSTLAASATAAASILAADALIGTAHQAAAYVWGGNTYIIESAGVGNGTLVAANDSVIELIGTHTLSTTVATGVFTLAS